MFDQSQLLNPGNFEGSMAQLAGVAATGMLLVLVAAVLLGLLTLPLFFLVITLAEGGLKLLDRTGLLVIKICLLFLRGLRRSLLRTSLSYLAVFILTFVLGGLYTIVNFLGVITSEKSNNLKVIMTEKYSIPSQMPPGYERRLLDLVNELPPEIRPTGGADDIMSWSFVGATTDPNNPRPENVIFLFCLEPRKILTMMDGLERKDLDAKELAQMEENIRKMNDDPQAIIVSPTRLKKLNMTVGERIKTSSIFYKDISFEFTIVGTLPDGKFEGVAMMNKQYLLSQIDSYERSKGTPHPLASKCLNLIWVRLPTREAFEKLAALANDPKNFSGPEVKLETSSALLSSIFEGLKDIVWAMKYLMSPAMIVIMVLVISTAISIGVRERRTELAVFKVLGFRPWHVAGMVLAEALLVGLLAGGMAAGCLYFGVGSIKVQLAVIGAFFVPWQVLVAGPLLGMTVAFVGSLLPALSAKNVKAVEVFSKVA
jgi:putative ABC transport system permease protein